MPVDLERAANYYQRLLHGWLTLSRPVRCADLACGSGGFLAYLQHCDLDDWIGVDSDAYQVKAARERFGVERVLLMDVFDFLADAQPGTYDLLSALDFVEHLTKQEFVRFAELARSALKTGGKLLLRTPNAAAPFGMAVRYGDFTHEISFTPGAISDILTSLEFEDVRVWEDGPRRGSVAQTAHWLAWHIARMWWVVLDGVETGGLGRHRVFTRNMWVLTSKATAD